MSIYLKFNKRNKNLLLSITTSGLQARNKLEYSNFYEFLIIIYKKNNCRDFIKIIFLIYSVLKSQIIQIAN
jgi:hypothetical protein